MDYKAAGVDIDAGNETVRRIRGLARSTFTPGVLSDIGSFGGLFHMAAAGCRDAVLVASADGVGTKLKVAFMAGRHGTVGQDLVNHCVNDIAVLGAEPLFFLDYLGTGKLEPHVFTQIIKGFARGCAKNGCALVGGETAQMPSFYQAGEYDLSGTIVGVVEKSRMLNGQRSVKRGDVVIGIASSGLHTNGYSLARKILFEHLSMKPQDFVADLGDTVGAELLKVHRTYGPLVQALLKKFNKVGKPDAVKALAHITGGGFVDNIPRTLPAKCDVVIRKGTWDVSPLFQILASDDTVDEAELYQVFNMGIGMTAIVAADQADAVLRAIKAAKHKAWFIGEVVKGTGICRVE